MIRYSVELAFCVMVQEVCELEYLGIAWNDQMKLEYDKSATNTPYGSLQYDH